MKEEEEERRKKLALRVRKLRVAADDQQVSQAQCIQRADRQITNIVDPRKMWGLGAPTTYAVENSHCWTLHILKILYKEARVRGQHACRPGASILNLKEYKPHLQTKKQPKSQQTLCWTATVPTSLGIYIRAHKE